MAFVRSLTLSVLIAVAGVMFGAKPGLAQPTVIYDSTGSSGLGADNLTLGLAESFTAPFTGVLTGVTLGVAALANNTAASFDVALYSDSNTTPGSALAILGTVPATLLSTTSSLVTVPITQTYGLTAGTRYWIALANYGSPSSSFFTWEYVSVASGIGVAGEYTFYDGTVLAIGNDANNHQMQLTETAIPEPASLVVLLSGAAGLLGLRRRRGIDGQHRQQRRGGRHGS